MASSTISVNIDWMASQTETGKSEKGVCCLCEKQGVLFLWNCSSHARFTQGATAQWNMSAFSLDIL